MTIKRKQPSMAISQKKAAIVLVRRKNITLDLPSKVSNTSNLIAFFPRISANLPFGLHYFAQLYSIIVNVLESWQSGNAADSKSAEPMLNWCAGSNPVLSFHV